MIQLDLTKEERDTLIAMLDGDLSDLRMEISHTDSGDYRGRLKVRKAILEKTLASLRSEPEQAPAH